MSRSEVYFNLHKKCLSVRDTGGRVRHASAVVMTDITFAVQPAGRARVVREGKKNVHAFVRGTVKSEYGLDTETGLLADLAGKNGYRRVTYDPYKYESFVYADSKDEVKTCNGVLILGRDIYEMP